MVGLRTGSEGQREEHRMDSKGGSQVQKDAEPGVGPRDLGFRVPTWGVRALPGGKAKESISWPGAKLDSETKPWRRLGADE